MIENLLKYPEAKSFLSDYPKPKWPMCIEAAFIYGLYSIKKDFPNGLSITELMKISGNDIFNSPTKSSPNKAPTRDEKTQTTQNPIRFNEPENLQVSSRAKDFSSQALAFNKLSRHESIDFCKDKSYQGNLDVNPVAEPKICSFKIAKIWLEERAGQVYRIKTGDEFMSSLGKTGFRKKAFPVVEMGINNRNIFQDSLNSSVFSKSLARFNN